MGGGGGQGVLKRGFRLPADAVYTFSSGKVIIEDNQKTFALYIRL